VLCDSHPLRQLVRTAQRRVLGLLRSMVLLLLADDFQTEEQGGAGPAHTRDLSRYLRKRSEPFPMDLDRSGAARALRISTLGLASEPNRAIAPDCSCRRESMRFPQPDRKSAYPCYRSR